MDKLATFTNAFLCTVLTLFLLSSASNILIPLLIAIIITFILISLAEGFSKLLHLPGFIGYVIAFVILLFFLWIVFMIVTSNVTTLVNSVTFYQKRLNELIDQLFRVLDTPRPTLNEKFDFDMVTIISSVVTMLTDIAGNAGMILIYTVFLLTEYHFFSMKLKSLAQKESSLKKTETVIRTIKQQIQSYFRIKTTLSFFTAFFSYLVMISIGIDFAVFWAFLIFLLNYIPTIGSIVATAFPCLLALLQFQTIWPFIFVTILLVSIQFIIGNIIEPRFMGKKFNLSALVILLSLAIWGKIWGIIGMFLSVPILVIASIILANFPQTRGIAILLSQDGKVE